MSYLELFFSFLKVGLFSIGGGYAAMPLIQSIVVDEKAWLTLGEFSDLVTIAEMTPGPIIINGATFIGMRVGGAAGVLAATAGSILPSLIIVSVLLLLYVRYKGVPLTQHILGGIRPAVVALIASAGLSILINAVFGGSFFSLANADYVAAVLFVLTFAVIRKKKLGAVPAMFICGILYMAINLIIG